MHSSKVYHATLLYRSFCVGMYIGGETIYQASGSATQIGHPFADGTVTPFNGR